jgi:hypothetical protein
VSIVVAPQIDSNLLGHPAAITMLFQMRLGGGYTGMTTAALTPIDVNGDLVRFMFANITISGPPKKCVLHW